MDKLNKSSWIINTTKHLNDIKINSYELDSFSETSFAGKSSILLSKLSSNNQEIIDGKKVRVFARDSYIHPENIASYLKALKNHEMVDFKLDNLDRPQEVEVYCFSNEAAIKVAEDIFEARVEEDVEKANIDLLEETFIMPLKELEIKEKLSSTHGYNEEDVSTILDLHKIFKITKENRGIIYNEYTFTGNEDKIIKSLSNLKTTEKEQVQMVLDEIGKNQGFLYDNLQNKFDVNILKMMEGVGMIEGIDVVSDFGEATFVTTPHIKGAGIGSFSISSDIFHKAKVLLSCLRFGQEKSTYGRGKISTEEKMLNIIKKLNRGEWLNPCTAAGEDYKLLEREGVVAVKPTGDGRYYMKLRQPEVGTLVEQMITYNKIVSTEMKSVDIMKQINATSYRNPEARRNTILANDSPVMKELQDKVLQSIRW
ncbi:hypothetical protein WS9_005700 [Paraclostridium sordellii 8483]|uniref:hypothetical protein n=1 Tax=Paraclostridium sordellii TaxID=1505 RepID=UPI0002E7BEBD|nr:hypothetical protein [Paeniclostridium sordellii]TAN68441.1 hypothetical protein WS9_005700 [Paeniclostridium sordellii 8483]